MPNGEKEENKWCTPVDGVIHVPDELDALVNKIGMQIKFFTISRIISEEECVCRIAYIAQKFFNKPKKEVPNDYYPGKQYQRLFDAIHDTGGIALDSEMKDIIDIVHQDFPKENT